MIEESRKDIIIYLAKTGAINSLGAQSEVKVSVVFTIPLAQRGTDNKVRLVSYSLSSLTISECQQFHLLLDEAIAQMNKENE